MITRDATWVRLNTKGRGKAYRFDKNLIQLCEGITRLLKANRKRGDVYVWATLDDFLGAVYALILAFHNSPPFKYRPKSQIIETRTVVKRARSVWVAGKIRTQGKWMSGFCFNNALFRLSAVYH